MKESSWRIAPPPIPEAQITETKYADVIVIGGGYAGTSAARAACEAGSSVILAEAMTEAHYRNFGVDIGHINSEFLAARGVPKVDPIELYNDLMLRSGNRANPKLIMQYCRNAGTAFDWFTDVMTQEEKDHVIVGFWPANHRMKNPISGQRFYTGTAQFFHEVDPKCPNLTDVLKRNHQKICSLGGDVTYGVKAEQLLMDGDRVIGVVGKKRDGSYVSFMANRSVVLAAGDFSGNEEMSRDLLCDIMDLLEPGETYTHMGRDGSGIRMGLWAGGILEPRPIAAMSGANATINSNVLQSNGELYLDESGCRFANECFGDPVFSGMAYNQLKRGVYYSVFDSQILEHLQHMPMAHGCLSANYHEHTGFLSEKMQLAKAAGGEGVDCATKGNPRENPENGRLFCADTLEELAGYLSSSEKFRKRFVDSVHRYNEMCRNGRDEDFGKDADLLLPLDKPPYYTQVVALTRPGKVMMTMGGLLTDGKQNVVNAFKEPIPGLFATGNCCGRRFTLQYSTPISGISISMAMTLGRECGKYAAEAQVR